MRNIFWALSIFKKILLQFLSVNCIHNNSWIIKLYFNSRLKVKVLVTQSCPTLCNPMDYNPLDSSVHGILQARILEWVAIPFSKGYSWSRDRTWVSCIAGRLFTIWATREATRLHAFYLYAHDFGLSCSPDAWIFVEWINPICQKG